MICCCGILRLVASSYHVVPGGAKTSLHLQWPRTEGGRVTLKEVYQALVARGLADDPRGEDGISRVLAATKKEYEDLSQEDRWEFDEDRLSHPFNDTRILTGDLQSEVNRVPVSYTHLRAHETDSYLVCRLLLEKKKTKT